jgi:elongator complex protein 4
MGSAKTSRADHSTTRPRSLFTTVMSSFKRKTGIKTEVPVGTRPSPSSPSTFLTSTGIPSLDDILGGGLPLSCSALVLAPDLHSAYGDLVHNYFLAQGLAIGHNIVLIGEDPLRVFDECMWSPASFAPEEDKKDIEADQQEEKIKIAWRYETMKQFQTTVESNQYVASQFGLVGFVLLRPVYNQIF